MSRLCKQCETSIDHKRKDAIYCTKVCKKAYAHSQNYQDPAFVEANRARGTKWRVDNPGRGFADTERWHRENPDRSAAIKGKEAAIRRGGSVAESYILDLCVPFYTESRRLTREAGIRYDVDHVIPLSKGGLHCQSNLQVLTQRENVQKGNKHDV